MKKLIIIILSGLCLPLMTIAQDNNAARYVDRPVWIVGAHGGFGPAWFKPNAKIGMESSGNIGISVIYSAREHVGIGADLRMSVEGGATHNRENYLIIPQLTYLRLPLKGIYFFRDYEDDFRPKIAFGPSVGFLTGEKRSNGARVIDPGVQASVGLNYRMADGVWLTGDANYYHGFLDVFPATSFRERNRHIHFDLGLSFSF